MIAAQRLGRRCYGMDIAPHYIDVAIKRWSAMTERQAVLEGQGRTFDEIAAARSAAAA